MAEAKGKLEQEGRGPLRCPASLGPRCQAPLAGAALSTATR